MKQTPSAIMVLAGAIFAAGCTIAYANAYENLGTWLGVVALVTGVCGGLFLIRACLLDHEMAVDVRGRLDFLEELVYLERIAMEHRGRRSEIRGEPREPGSTLSFERYSNSRAA